MNVSHIWSECSALAALKHNIFFRMENFQSIRNFVWNRQRCGQSERWARSQKIKYIAFLFSSFFFSFGPEFSLQLQCIHSRSVLFLRAIIGVIHYIILCQLNEFHLEPTAERAELDMILLYNDRKKLFVIHWLLENSNNLGILKL